MIYLQLYWEFFKTGLFAIGGGLATLPFLYKMSSATGWFTTGQLADMVAVSESTPGPLGINMATYVGFTTAGVPGALIATFGLITAPVIIILIISAFLKSFKDNRYVQWGFYGLRPASTGLIATAGLQVVFLALFNQAAYDASGNIQDFFNVKALILAAVILVCSRYVPKVKDLHPILFILFAAVVGIVFQFGSAG